MSRRAGWVVAVLIAMTSLGVGGPSNAAGVVTSEPRKVLEAHYQKLRKINRTSRATWREQFAKHWAEFIDNRQFAERILVGTWEGLPAAQRARFEELFQHVLARRYQRHVPFHYSRNFDVAYTKLRYLDKAHERAILKTHCTDFEEAGMMSVSEYGGYEGVAVEYIFERVGSGEPPKWRPIGGPNGQWVGSGSTLALDPGGRWEVSRSQRAASAF